MSIVWLKNDLRHALIYESESWLPYETGGILMGYIDIKGNIVITDMIKAGPDALHEKELFKPDSQFQDQELAKIYNNSQGVITYLGDWHSHPNGRSYLSLLDRRTMAIISKTKSSRQRYPIFIVLGTSKCEIRCWRYYNGKIIKLRFEIY